MTKECLKNDSQRTPRLYLNILASFLLKGWSALVVFIMVPLVLKMLGKHDNGVWLTISSLLVWIDMMDIGLGNGLRNSIAVASAQGNVVRIREAVSSTLFMLAIVIVIVGTVLYALVAICDTHALLGVEANRLDNLDSTLVVAIVMVSATFFLKTTGNVYMGMQLPAVNNLLVTFGQTLALFGTVIAYFAGWHSLFAVVLINVSAPMLVWLLSFPYTFIIKYPQFCPSLRYVNMATASRLSFLGIKFFILQICSVLLFASTNFIISQIISPEEVTTYQVAYRYFSIMLVVFTVVCMPFWNATTDAYTRGDFAWIRGASRKMNMLLGIIALCFGLMVLLSDTVYFYWVGEDVDVPISLSVVMAMYLFIIIASMRYSYFLNGIGELRIQLIFTISATLLFLPLAWSVCSYYQSVTSLVVIMCLVNIPGLVANVWKFQRIVK